MDPQRWQEIKEILDEASRLEARERESYLGRACGDNGALRVEVESLLPPPPLKLSIIFPFPLGCY